MYKLEEIARRTQVLRRGQRVLDLGAAPGSWTLYAAEQVGPKGHVLAIDLNELQISPATNIEIRQGDAREADDLGTFDVVLSDMAPKTSGQRAADQYRSYELVMTALAIAKRTLVPGGSLVAKIFQGPEFEDARSAFRACFGKVRILRPKAVRDESYEVFLVGLNFRPEEGS
ncbi:MAG: RlmE family RNA methyltransferase [Myxococcota bacterium]